MPDLDELEIRPDWEPCDTRLPPGEFAAMQSEEHEVLQPEGLEGHRLWIVGLHKAGADVDRIRKSLEVCYEIFTTKSVVEQFLKTV